MRWTANWILWESRMPRRPNCSSPRNPYDDRSILGGTVRSSSRDACRCDLAAAESVKQTCATSGRSRVTFPTSNRRSLEPLPRWDVLCQSCWNFQPLLMRACSRRLDLRIVISFATTSRAPRPASFDAGRHARIQCMSWDIYAHDDCANSELLRASIRREQEFNQRSDLHAGNRIQQGDTAAARSCKQLASSFPRSLCRQIAKSLVIGFICRMSDLFMTAGVLEVFCWTQHRNGAKAIDILRLSASRQTAVRWQGWTDTVDYRPSNIISTYQLHPDKITHASVSVGQLSN